MKRTRVDGGDTDVGGKKIKELNGFSHANGFSPQNDVLNKEYERQISCLNQAFSTWIKSNAEGNPLAIWRDGCHDYITYAQQLRSKFRLRGWVLSFGSGDCGQLGHGTEEDEDLSVGRPRVIEALKDKIISSVACGGMHNLVVEATKGELFTWGCADNDVLGRKGDENFPAPVSFPHKVRLIQVSAGDCHSAAIGMNGACYIWGTYLDKDGRKWWNTHADGAKAFGHTQLEPMLVTELEGKHGGISQIASGANHTIALCTDGQVYSWGIGDVGQLGRKVCELKDDDGVYRKDDILKEHLVAAPMRYEKDKSIVDTARFVAAGSYHTFIILAMRSRVFATGLNQYGQLGVKPSKTDFVGLIPVPSLDGKDISCISAGEHFSLALSSAGEVYSFGRADQSQLGIELEEKDKGAGAFLSEPQLVKGPLEGQTIVSIATGSSHSLVITDQHMVYSWGFGDMNQLGHNKEADETLPKLITRFHKSSNDYSTTGVVHAYAGGQHSILLVQKA